jgi:hypothetical protein
MNAESIPQLKEMKARFESLERRAAASAVLVDMLHGQLARQRQELATVRLTVVGNRATIDAAEATPISTAEPLRPDGNIGPALSGGKPINFAGAGSERNVPVSGGSKQQ